MKWIILFYGQSIDGVGELVTAVKTGEDIDYQNYLLLTILGLQDEDVSVIMKKHS